VLFHTQEFWRKDTKNMRLRQPCGRILAQSLFFLRDCAKELVLANGRITAEFLSVELTE
jgi:hypothetical protein